MRKIWLLSGVVFLFGCMAVRTYETEKPRIDTTIEGNQGFLAGTPKIEPKESKLGPNRKISVMEIEIGFTKTKSAPKKSSPAETPSAESSTPAPEVSAPAAAADTQNYTPYTVGKDDTLQKISQKFYGTTRKWKLIYDNNLDVIKNPDRLYPGTQIKIPAL